MEVTGLALGVVGLAGIFGTCLECFELFKNAKSLRQDFEDLLLILDCQKERLMTWGELVGILHSGDKNADPQNLVGRCLLRIISLLSDAEQLEKRYGMQPSSAPIVAHKSVTGVDSGIGSERFKRLQQSFQKLTLSNKGTDKLGVHLKTKWAILDKARFESLVSLVRDLVNELHHLVPVKERSQIQMVYSDIAMLDVPELRQIERVCEDALPTWSDVASAIRIASEAGTVGTSSILRERYNQVDSVEDDNVKLLDLDRKRENVVSASRGAFDIVYGERDFSYYSANKVQFYFIFTPDCFGLNSRSRCDEAEFDDICLQARDPGSVSHLAQSSSVKSHTVGGRIVTTMGISYTDGFNVDELKKVGILASIYVYCAPCASAIRSAFQICDELRNSKGTSGHIRIDDRIDATCCAGISKKSHLKSMVNAVKHIEIGTRRTEGWVSTWKTYVDRVWLENSLYRAEESDVEDSDRVNAVKGIFSNVPLESRYNAIVILGEVDRCSWMIQTKPFPWTARMPQETEIFRIHANQRKEAVWQRTYLGTYTPRSFMQNELPPVQAARSTIDLRPPRPKRRKSSTSESEFSIGS